MTNTTARLGLIFESDGARVVMPLGMMTAFIALVGFMFPSATGLAMVAWGAAMVVLSGLTWFYVQIVAMMVIGKIVIDCILWLYNGGQNHDYYE